MSYSNAGKGSSPRPFSVKQDEFDQRWDAIFGDKKTVSDQNHNQEDLTKFLGEISESLTVYEQTLIRDSERLWNQLTPDEQLLAFCYVCRKITEAKRNGRSYRGTLYDVFGFGLESYGAAQISGFIDIHNSSPIRQTSHKEKS